MEWVDRVTQIKLSDWMADRLVDYGIEHVFMVTGGGAMHMNQSFGGHAKLKTIFMHHEQALSIAGEAYYRYANKLAVVNVTSGPGGTNAITGVYGGYTDSIGMLVISGQVKIETTVRHTGLPLRQYGDQELDIEEVVRPITKYVVMVTDPRSIRYHLEKALYLATHGRPGPVWLDIPLDVQAAKIDPDDLLPGFDPAELDEPWRATDLTAAAADIVAKLKAAERPVIFAGNGVRLSGAYGDFLTMIDKLGIPVVPGFNGRDLLHNDHPLYCGRPGTIGDRGGNMVTQSSDCLLILGSRLNIRQVSYNWTSFARAAHKIWVDIDPVELRKPNVVPDTAICADLAELIPAITAAAPETVSDVHCEWLEWSKERVRRFPTVLPEYEHNQVCHPYVALDKVFRGLDKDDIVVTANATACVVSFQVSQLQEGMRLWSSSGSATMGYDLPGAVGVCAATHNRRRVICIAGDGSIMMNLQELQTIASNNLPVKIILLNNSGYVSIFQTHRNFFGREIGGGPKSGVNFPDFGKVVTAFGFSHFKASRHDEIDAKLAETLAHDGPAVLELILDEQVAFQPKLGSKQHPDGRITSPPLEDLSPFLPREVLAENMRIPLMEE